jgi:hypothetical protein
VLAANAWCAAENAVKEKEPLGPQAVRLAGNTFAKLVDAQC